METGFLDADPFMALDIYEASMLLGIHRAIKEIKRISLIGSKMERLLVWYRTANKGSSGRDRQAALRLVASRFDEVVADERFLRLSVAEVVPLFSCSRLGTSGEVPVFLAALRWLNHDYCKRQQYVVQLLKCVRFSLMSREEIVHCFHPPLLSNITRFPSVAFMVLAAFGVVSLQEEGREHLLSRFASQPRTFLCPKPDDQHQTSLWPLPGPPEGSVAQRRHRAATALQTAWRVRKARRDLALKRRQAKGVSMTDVADTDVGTADSYAPRTHLRESSLKNVNDTSGVEASKEAQSVKSNESVTSDSSTRTMPSPVKEPFTPILKVVIKEERSVRDKSGMATDDSLLRSQASLLKLVPPPKKEDKVRTTPEKALPIPPKQQQSPRTFAVSWNQAGGSSQELAVTSSTSPLSQQQQQQTEPPRQQPSEQQAQSQQPQHGAAAGASVFTVQIVGDVQSAPSMPRPNRSFEFSFPEKERMTTPFPCDFDKEFDMKSFQETASCAGEVPRARSPSTRTARARTPERNISSPTSFQTVRTRSEAAWGFADDFDRKSRSRFWPYDAKSTFTNLSGSFESLDPFSRQHHGNFAVSPSMAKHIGKVQLVTAIELPSILVTGGLNLDTGISSSVVAFDPSFNTLQQCSVLPTPLHHHRTVLVDSDVIVVGGMLESADGPYLCTRRCYRLNVAKMQWNRVADLKTERAHHGLVYCDGRILALGGLTLGRRLVSSMEYYDVKRNKWTKMKGSLPQPMMAMGVALFRSLVWVAGGVVGSSEEDLACCTAVHCYDPRTKTWTSTVPPLPRACAYLGLICASGSLVALGGSVSLDQLQPGSVADVLRLSDDQRFWEPLASMPRPCHSSDAVVFGESLYMFGGISDGHVLADVQLLHKGRWSLCAHLPASVLGPSVVALPGSHAGASSAVSATSDPVDNRSGRKDEDLIMWSWHNL
ncbi:uncharacterized protein LOC119405034 [Rhipicephalus sanguineus]|nr:uncharacterized protein LOC119405034 [Rhipicephalus sanguineus]